MEVQEAIEKRKSIRSYKDEPIPENKLQKVLEAARLAPSGGNRQEWKFVVVRDEEKRKQLSKAANGQAHVAAAPVVIAGVATGAERNMMCEVPAYPVDLSVAIDHMTLAAVEEGLGSCWIGAFSQDEARRIIGVPDTHKIVSLLTLGLPADDGRPKTRKSIDEIICYDIYSE
ncbi:nitroreductase family protein [Chloroflexota bacterium]